jgi:photosystem II stability/assembly factor-like uncharacterized protein
MIHRRFVAAVLLAIATIAVAQQSPAPVMPEALLKGMKWREVGPFRGGRVLAVTGIPGDPETFFFGAVSGGVWKTSDGGNSWQPLGFDKQPVSSIGAIAVAEMNPNVIYVGSGEACIRGNISYGDGVYKSTDGGKTWVNVGLKDSRQIGAVIVNPHNSDIVFVAALGHAFGPNAERGLFRTLDGGKTWEKVLAKDDQTGAIDVVFDPHNPNVLFAALYQVVRTPWSMTSGGPGSGLYKSVDGGTTWTQLKGDGLPEGILGRIGVSVSGADSNRVYALIEAEKGGLYVSEDGGAKWKLVNSDQRFRQRAWYFTHIFADPKNVETVYILNTGMFRSTDGGKTFTLLPAPHGDHHGLWIDPTNPMRMINGNDGGATITTDGGKTWTTLENQPTAQFYHVIADNQYPYYVYGAQQDNSTIAIASRTDFGVIGRADWYPVGGGESGYIAPDPRDANIVYAGGNEGVITRYSRRDQQAQDVSVWPLDTSGHGAGDFKYRFQWTEPIIISPHDPNTIYTAGQFVFKSADQGMSWTQISPDLTRNDKSKQVSSGGPLTKDNTSVEYYDTVFTLGESPLQKNLIWAGSDDGLVHITQDGGAHWTNVTPKDLPEWSMVSLIEASPHSADAAYIAVDRHKLDDIKPYIWKTADFGKTWTRINTGIPDGAFVHAVREDPARQGLLYAGTETGVFVSFDDGARWQPLQLNLPTSPIHDLVIKNDDLVVATHGRSFWILDDVTPLRQAAAQVANDEVYLFKPRAAFREHWPEVLTARGPVGLNPPLGAIVYYYLKNAPAKGQEITLEVLDAQGKLVRKYSNIPKKEAAQPGEWPEQEKASDLLPAEAGANRFNWNLRFESPVQVPGAFYAGNPPEGPLALPGQYQLRLTVAGKSYTAPLEVKLDPRVKAAPDGLQKSLALGLQVRERISDLHLAVNQIRDLRAQLTDLKKRLGTNARSKAIVEAADNIDKAMTPVEHELIQVNMKSSEGNLNFPNMLNEEYYSFSYSIDAADAAPTQQQYGVAEDLGNRLNAQLAKWKQLLTTQVPALNQQIQRENIPVILVGSGRPEEAAATPGPNY